jgi:hypothetical protein
MNKWGLEAQEGGTDVGLYVVAGADFGVYSIVVVRDQLGDMLGGGVGFRMHTGGEVKLRGDMAVVELSFASSP